MSAAVANYCANVCGAKCCYDGANKCRHLNTANLCSIYAERFADGAPDAQIIDHYFIETLTGTQLKTLACWRITKLIERGLLPKHIEDQCCIAHPELLKD